MKTVDELGTNVEPSKQLRRLRLMVNRGLFADELAGLTVCRATSVETLRQAYQLVYQVFVARGYIAPSEDGVRVRVWDTTADSAMYVVIQEQTVVACFAILCDEPLIRLPADKVFGDVLAPLRKDGQRLCELSNQVVLPAYRHTSAVTELMRCIGAHCWHFGVDTAVCMVNPGLQALYETIGFVARGGIRPIGDVPDDQVVLMVFERIFEHFSKVGKHSDPAARFLRRFFETNNPYMAVVPFWHEQARRLFEDSEAMSALFGKNSDLFARASSDERFLLTQRLGPMLPSHEIGDGAGLMLVR